MVGNFDLPGEGRIADALKHCFKMGFCSSGDTIVSLYHCVFHFYADEDSEFVFLLFDGYAAYFSTAKLFSPPVPHFCFFTYYRSL